MMKCMLHARPLPPKLWVKAINYAYYNQKRIPHKLVKGITPFEPLTWRKPNVTHFRVFGSCTWARTPFDKKKDMEP